MSGRLRKTLVGATAFRVMAAVALTGAMTMPPPVLSGAERGAPRGAPRGAAEITASTLKAYLTFISSDEMEGRDTPSRGLDITARFLAVQLARAGAEPAGDNGTWFQRIGLTTRKVDPEKTTATLTDKKPRSFTYGHDFLAAAVPGVAEGSLIYVGHGYVIKEKNLDAYKGLDVAGKIVVSHSGYPPGVSRNDVRGPSGERWESAVTYAAKHGGKGVIYIPSFDALTRWDRNRSEVSEEGSTRMDTATSARPKEPEVPSITASPEMLSAIFEDEKVSARDIFRRAQTNEPADGFALSASKQVRFSVEATATPVPTQNVVAIVRGSDPKLKDEYVAIGAHYDHVGVAGRGGRSREGEPGADVIYNGADDDGSGTTALLVMAEAAARLKPRPKRSLLFVWHAGEERGLWGSAYYADHPTVPLDRIVAQLNVDMIGRSRAPNDTNPENKLLTGPNEVYVIGSKMMSSSLAELSERVNDGYLKMSFNYHYDDPNDASRLFFRSDHYNYAKKGIPIIFYFSGLHEDYHQPSDSVEKIDFTKMERVTRTIYATALALADSPSRPKVDRTLPRQLTEP
jgi:hypothetical protein